MTTRVRVDPSLFTYNPEKPPKLSRVKSGRPKKKHRAPRTKKPIDVTKKDAWIAKEILRGRTVKEIALELGEPENHVKWIIWQSQTFQKAYKQFRAEFEAELRDSLAKEMTSTIIASQTEMQSKTRKRIS